MMPSWQMIAPPGMPGAQGQPQRNSLALGGGLLPGIVPPNSTIPGPQPPGASTGTMGAGVGMMMPMSLSQMGSNMGTSILHMARNIGNLFSGPSNDGTVYQNTPVAGPSQSFNVPATPADTGSAVTSGFNVGPGLEED